MNTLFGSFSGLLGCFQALAEPTRLQILNLLRSAAALGRAQRGRTGAGVRLPSANISRHLALLTQHGVVARESRLKPADPKAPGIAADKKKAPRRGCLEAF